MWTVLVADDEPKIRRRLTALVEAQTDSFRICAEADDGLKALELVREELPDILLVDIRMPRMNGLEFIDRIKQEAENCIVIVITGHDEFEYAQRAVHLPVFEYLLKPVRAETLAAVLERATGVLKERRSRNEIIQWAEREVVRDREGLLQELFDDWLQGFASAQEIADRKRVLSLPEGERLILVAVQVNAQFYGRTASEVKEHHVRKLAVRKLVMELVGVAARPVAFEDPYDRLLLVLEDAPAGLAEQVKRESQARLNIPVQVATVDCHLDHEEFIEAYERACALLGGNSRVETIAQNFVAFMDEQYGDKELNLLTAASALALSPGYLSRVLKQQTGYSFSEFMNRYRVCKAVQLMSGSNKLMYEIAEEVGYSSQHYFSRVFRRITGNPPTDYRRREECKE